MVRKNHHTTDLVYGIWKGRELKHISEVPSGKACECVCPQCNHPLIAKKGPVYRHHFGHAAESECSGAPETALHLMAKEIICKRLCLGLPALVAEYNGVTQQIFKSRIVFFDSATAELRHDIGFIPDISVFKDDRKLMVEIFVTHPCGEEKITEIAKAGVSSVEIDLSKFPRDASLSEIEAAVISDAPRRWLYHPHEVVAREQMKLKADELRKLEEGKQESVRKELERKANSLVRNYSEGIRSLDKFDKKNIEILSRVKAAGFGNILGISFGGEGAFNLPTDVWQAEIVGRFIISPEVEGTLKASSIYGYLKGIGAVGHQFKFISPETERLLQTKIDKFLSPYAAVTAYLKYLVELGVLVFRRGYIASSLTVRTVDKFQESNRLRMQRAKDVQEKFTSIASGLSEDFIRTYNFENWRKKQQVLFDCSFEEAIESGKNFNEMYGALIDIERMLFEHGSIVDEWLDFPIKAEVERCRKFFAEKMERRRIEAQRKNEEARRLRVQNFLDLAGAVHESEAENWIVQRNSCFGGRLPIKMAGSSVESYEEVMAQLNLEQSEKLKREREEIAKCEAEIRRRESEEVNLREVREWQEKLQKRAVSILGGGKAMAFLVSPYSQLNGKRPKDYCVNKVAYERCEILLNEVKKGIKKLF